MASVVYKIDCFMAPQRLASQSADLPVSETKDNR